MWRMRELADKVTNVVMNYTEVEAKVREATNDDAWGPTGPLMQEVAQATFTFEHFPEVMTMLWKRMLQDNKKNWRRTYKSLLLLNYLVRNGSERVVTSSREHIYDLRGLENYVYVDEMGKDQGINIRHKVKELIDFIQDDDKLREERKKAKKNKDKYVGLSSDAMGLRGIGERWEGTTGKWGKEEYDWSDSAGRRDDYDPSGDEGDNSEGETPAPRSPARVYRDTENSIQKDSPIKKQLSPGRRIDLGAAATYGKTASTNGGNTENAEPTNVLPSLIGDVADDLFDPRKSVDPPTSNVTEFGDFTNAFPPANSNTSGADVKDDFADFSSAFTSPSPSSLPLQTHSLPPLQAHSLPPLQPPLLNGNSTVTKSQSNTELLMGLSGFNSPVHSQAQSLDLTQTPQSPSINPLDSPMSAVSSWKKLEDAKDWLLKFIALLPGPLVEQRIIFYNQENGLNYVYYARVLEAVISLPGELRLLDQLFVVEGGSYGMFIESLTILSNSLKEEPAPSSRLDRTLHLLQKLITSEALVSAAIDICLFITNNSCAQRAIAISRWEEMVQLVVSLPVKVANRLEGHGTDVFQSKNFSKYIFVNLAKVIGIIYNLKRNLNIIVDNTPVALLFSKIVSNFYFEDSAKLFFKIMSSWCNERPLFKFFISDVLAKLDQKCVERTATLILQTNDLMVSDLLGNCILQPSWKYVLCRKIPFLIFHSCDNIIINLVKYLGSLDDKSFLSNTLTDLLRIWSDRSALKHTSHDQHLYITKIILLSLRHLNDHIKNHTKLKSELKIHILHGVPVHLESTVENIRVMGMVTGEFFMSLIEKDTNNKLNFDYSELKSGSIELADKLKRIADYDFKNDSYLCSESGDDLLDKMLCSLPELKKEETPKSLKNQPISIIPKINEDIEALDLDSDDEFEPYDLSNDVKNSVLKRPKYLRDLLENLNSENDFELWEESIKASEELVLKQLPSDDVSLAIALLNVFLTLNRRFNLEDFETYRFNTCVAIVRIKPVETSEYLGLEFNTIGKYSLSTRHLMLDILAVASQQLSKPSEEQKKSAVILNKILGQVKRVSTKPQLKVGGINKFLCVGSFIFPLIRGKFFKENDESPVLLAAALRTIAVITLSSQNLGQLTVKICKEVLELSWFMRYHSELSVRGGAMDCVASVLLAASDCLEQLSEELVEAEGWLIDSVKSEQDPALKVFATNIILLIQQSQIIRSRILF
ncbi:telomere length regulation protein TEL2 homolog [Halyomorpha halys]|uniref:telomere length regulation protein TEL2 homolog n=1 Tax=Halyomorpha halys TaxID=286706 RepID=UPI0006D51AA3|nr:telomere length regulation protein TEL2 homolog [Halyomorpha halys]